MSVRLHKAKGINPRLTVCIRCGKDTGLVLLGANESIWSCHSCGRRHIGGHPKKCPCGSEGFNKVGVVGDREKLPDGLCDDCKKERDLHAQEVAKGGIYWKCTDCKNTGVIKHTSFLAQLVRKKAGIEAPKEVGVEFTKDTCPACQNVKHLECC